MIVAKFDNENFSLERACAILWMLGENYTKKNLTNISVLNAIDMGQGCGTKLLTYRQAIQSQHLLVCTL